MLYPGDETINLKCWKDLAYKKNEAKNCTQENQIRNRKERVLEWPAPRFLNSSFFPYSPFLLILFKMERTNLYTKVCHFIDTSIIPKRTSLHRFFSNQSHEHPHLLKSYKVAVLCHLCPTLCDPLDYSPPACSVHGIFQARIQEWVAISFSRGFS